MSRDYRSSQVTDLLRCLAQIPGSAEIHLRARRFTRFGPAQPASTYQELADSFPPDKLPETVIVPADPDEIAVTVQGSLPQDTQAESVMDQIDDLVHVRLGVGWDLRAQFPRRESDRREFMLTVFLDPTCECASYHAPAD